MHNIMFIVILLFFIVAFILFQQNFIKHRTNSINRRNNNDSCHEDKFNAYSNPNSIINGKDKYELNTSNYIASSLNFSPFLDRIGYFLASNDEKNSIKYIPTSLQDTDPKDLA